MSNLIIHSPFQLKSTLKRFSCIISSLIDRHVSQNDFFLLRFGFPWRRVEASATENDEYGVKNSTAEPETFNFTTFIWFLFHFLSPLHTVWACKHPPSSFLLFFRFKKKIDEQSELAETALDFLESHRHTDGLCFFFLLSRFGKKNKSKGKLGSLSEEELNKSESEML